MEGITITDGKIIDAGVGNADMGRYTPGAMLPMRDDSDIPPEMIRIGGTGAQTRNDMQNHIDCQRRERMLELAIRGCPSSDAKRLVNDAKMLEAYVLGEQKTEDGACAAS